MGFFFAKKTGLNLNCFYLDTFKNTNVKTNVKFSILPSIFFSINKKK